MTQNEGCNAAELIAVFNAPAPDAYFFPYSEAYLPKNTIESFFQGKMTNNDLWKPVGSAPLGKRPPAPRPARPARPAGAGAARAWLRRGADCRRRSARRPGQALHSLPAPHLAPSRSRLQVRQEQVSERLTRRLNKLTRAERCPPTAHPHAVPYLRFDSSAPPHSSAIA